MHLDEIYINKVEELGEKMATRGHSLVFGAGDTGLMGAAARGVKKADGYVHGIVPSFFRDGGIERLFEKCDRMTYTETMRERKALMEEEADAFIVVPGGIGTFEEFFEILTLKQLNRHEKAIVIFDIEGYYDELDKFMQTAVERKFVAKSCLELYKTFTTSDEVLDYIENYKPVKIPFSRTKLGE
jgi:hypothetical protein